MDESNLPVIPIIAVITTYHWTAIIWLVTARTDPDLVTPLVADLVQREGKLAGLQGEAGSKIDIFLFKKIKFLLISQSYSAVTIVIYEISAPKCSALCFN